MHEKTRKDVNEAAENAQRPTFNVKHPLNGDHSSSFLDWMLDVER